MKLLSGLIAPTGTATLASISQVQIQFFLQHTKVNVGQTAHGEPITLRPNAVGLYPSAYRSPGPSW